MEPPQGFDVNCFLKAACEGDLHTLQGLVAQFENGEGPGKVLYAELRAPDGSNALHWAADLGKTSTCRYLVGKLNFNVNETTKKGETPLLRAIVGKHRPTILFFINHGADVNKCTISGEAPLHIVAEEGMKDLVKLLVSKGADLSASSVRGMPLHYAAASGKRHTLQCLLESKADPNPTSLEMSPLMLSMIAKSPECLDLLLKAGADPNRPCQQATPLRYAASKLDEEYVRRLLKAGANPNISGFDGCTPLEHAALLDRLKAVKVLFPLTSRIECYPDWSIRGVMQHVQSKEKIVLLSSKYKEFTQMAQEEGRIAFEAKRYLDAINWYNQAIVFDPANARIIFNRSLCYTNLDQDISALEDALLCITLEPSWAKAHYREGAAWKALKDFKKAAEAFSRALAFEPGNKEIQEALRDARMWTEKPIVEYFGKV